MQVGGHIDTWQKRKRDSLLLILAAGSLLAICFSLRFVPSMNDVISGKPEYMRWMADGFARGLASKVGDDFAIITLRDESNDCQREGNANAFSDNDAYYVLSYSENAHSLCILTYAQSRVSSGHAGSLLLTPETGRNYGRKLDSPVKVVPVGHVHLTFPLSYLSLLHWRARIDSSSFSHAGDATVQRSLADGLPVNDVNVEINFPDLRAAVGRRHNAINWMLASVISISVLLISFGAVRLRTLHRDFRAFLAHYRGQADFLTFLSHDLRMIGGRAREAHQKEQQRALEEARAATLIKRSKEATRARLESVFNALRDDRQRLRVQECLSRNEFDEMKALTQELQGQTGQKTPEERLTALLDTLKEYCTNEEFDRYCAEAFQILAATDFREARSFVVGAHDRLRARSKELEKQELLETEGGAPAGFPVGPAF